MDAGDLAGSVTFASGVALVWLSGGLARRKRRAWLAALGVITFAAAAHLAEGFDIEEAIGSLVLLVALLRLRRWFDAPGDPTSLRPLVAGLGVALVAWAIVGSAASDHLNRITDLGFELVLAAGAFWALYQWLRAHREPCGQTDADFERARALVADHGRTACRSSRSAATAGTCSRGPGTRFWPTAWSPAAPWSPAIPSDLPTTCPGWSTTSPPSAASAAGGSSCCTPPTGGSRSTVRAECGRSRAATRRCSTPPGSRSTAARSGRCASPSPGCERAGFAFRVAAPDDLSEAERADVDARHARVARRSRRPRVLDGDG